MDTCSYMCIYTEYTYNYTSSYKFMKICDMNKYKSIYTRVFNSYKCLEH